MLPEVVYNYVEDVDPNLTCAICQSALVDPVTTTSCKHTFCRDCISRALSHNPACPIDRSALTPASLRDTEPLVKLMLDELKVRCDADGCGAVMERGLLLAHLRTCTASVVVCGDGCGLSRMPHHRAYECFQRRMECGRCGTMVAFREAKAPPTAADVEAGTTCAQCSQTVTTSKQAHRWACPAVRMPCVHSARGCPVIVPRAELDAHLSSCPFERLAAYFTQTDDRFRAMEDKQTALERENDALRAHVERLRRAPATLGERLAEALAVGHMPSADAVTGLVAASAPAVGGEPSPAAASPPSDDGLTTRAAADVRAAEHARAFLAPPRRNYADWTLNRLGARGVPGAGEDGALVDAVRGAVVQLAAGLDAVERRTEV